LPIGGDKLFSSALTLQFRFILENKSERDSFRFIVVNFFKTNKEKELKIKRRNGDDVTKTLMSIRPGVQ